MLGLVEVGFWLLCSLKCPHMIYILLYIYIYFKYINKNFK
jgi:hypothetical protein